MPVFLRGRRSERDRRPCRPVPASGFQEGALCAVCALYTLTGGDLLFRLLLPAGISRRGVPVIPVLCRKLTGITGIARRPTDGTVHASYSAITAIFASLLRRWRSYADAPFPATFSCGLGPAPFKRTICCSRSNQNGAPNSVEKAVISQPSKGMRKPGQLRQLP